MKPRLLDTFCKAGGAGMGYHRAGFEVVGVDHEPQKHYPFAFIQADALEYIAAHGREYDVIHASPPCQGYSRMRHLPWLKGKKYPLLIEETRKLLSESGRLWAVENVQDAPVGGIVLCGRMFGLAIYRHRRFESNTLLWEPEHPRHEKPILKGKNLGDRASLPVMRINRSRTYRAGCPVLVSSHQHGAAIYREAMGIDWMTRDELSQAIPPAYTEYIGRQLLAALAWKETP